MTRMLLLAGLAICLWASSATAQQAGDRGPLFQIDPIVDTAFTTGVLGVAMMGEAFISTGEIEAQVPDDEAELLGIDAWIAQRNSASLRAAQVSDIGVYVAAAWAATDTALAWLGNRQDAGLTYFVIYAQSAATTWFGAHDHARTSSCGKSARLPRPRRRPCRSTPCTRQWPRRSAPRRPISPLPAMLPLGNAGQSSAAPWQRRPWLALGACSREPTSPPTFSVGWPRERPSAFSSHICTELLPSKWQQLDFPEAERSAYMGTGKHCAAWTA